MKQLIKGTFEEFLHRNNLIILSPLFHASHTVQGYGHIDEIAALYGLMWNTPNVMLALKGRVLGKTNTGINVINIYVTDFFKLHMAVPEDNKIGIHNSLF